MELQSNGKRYSALLLLTQDWVAGATYNFSALSRHSGTFYSAPACTKHADNM